MLKTFATLFTGAGGADEGIRQAGLTGLWGVEKSRKFAKIARANDINVKCQDVLSLDFDRLERPDVLHVSPPCQRASVANVGKGEGLEDQGLAAAINMAIAILKPAFFTLENVEGYARFRSFARIKTTLEVQGYFCRQAVLNAADFGVPQTRRRLFLIAAREFVPVFPLPTHCKRSRQISMFQRPWAGWKEAIAHLPEPKEAELTGRMIAKLPGGPFDECLVTGFKNAGFERNLTMRSPDEPAPTILASMERPTLMPWIVSRDASGKVYSRVLELQHTACLQGFPAAYKWVGTPTAARQAIGNAVAVDVIRQIVEANMKAKPIQPLVDPSVGRVRRSPITPAVQPSLIPGA